MTSYSQLTAFRSVSSASSNLLFTNEINENKEINIMKYDYLYNGAGVGVGDFNNDGWVDIFFAGNMVSDRLFMNLGESFKKSSDSKAGFCFEDATEKAGIKNNGWSTGVCVFDVNGDGWEDIYVCRSGPSLETEELRNVLYVNNQNGTFTERAAEFGLDLPGHHTQAAPLDIDLDGDLDLYIMGHPGTFAHKTNFQDVMNAIQTGLVESDVLLENVGGKYIDITKEAGILEFGYGLGLAITDLNLDGYPDIIVCNDFDEPDHIFINKGNNTFKDENLNYFKHTSNYSMGNDVGDFNNDGLLDYISVDMAFEEHSRSKTNMASMDPNKFYARVQAGWGYQYMHNMLQLNTGMGTFQEISQFAGVAKTDWSWAPLFMDIDMDGFQDLFVTNGYKRDTKNNDIGYLLNQVKEKKGEVTLEEFLELIPKVRIENFFFKNSGNLTFQDKRGDWGVNEKLNSNGAAYADFDRDGDLDLVISNVDTLASLYENQISEKAGHVIIDFSSLKQKDYLGLKFELITKMGHQIREAYFVRGYCSTVEKKLYFYLSEDDKAERLIISFPNGDKKYMDEIPTRFDLILDEKFSGFKNADNSVVAKRMFEDVTDKFRLDAVYLDNKFNDFEQEILLPHMQSRLGPEIAVGDIDNNGFEDFIVTSAVGNIPTVFLQSSNGSFKKMVSPSFYNHQASEDSDISIFDVNGDKKLDIMVSSGGYQWPEGDTALENRLYIGNGVGMFGLVNNAMPKFERTNSGKIVSQDIDNDGDLDFLICGRSYPQKYPYSGKTKIYVNENGFFRDKTKEVAPQIESLGIVSDAVFTDYDGDGDKDILLVGEWMNIEFMENQGGTFIHRKSKVDLSGWWNCIKAIDIDNDGDDDYVLGNAGMNNKFRATQDNPLDIYVNDFDNSGTLDIVLAYTKNNHQVPVRGKECSTTQMPFISDKFPTYIEFANSDLEQIYGSEKLKLALHYRVTEFRSGILYNNGEAGFLFKPFPYEVQLSVVNDCEIMDLNGDGILDIIGVGNRYSTEVETSRSDAGTGFVLIQTKGGNFEFVHVNETGFLATNDAKSMAIIRLGKEKRLGILVGNNNHRVQLFEYNR